ncbi:MAG TPA: fumarylacetoacetase [Gemmatimonadales bacterium]|nr:fumarylacetoacetase [Gemmatimonadales bacterium]
MTQRDRTHDPVRRSWVASANGHRDFPIQNLPFAVVRDGNADVLAVAIGDEALLLNRAIATGWGADLAPAVRDALRVGPLNAFAQCPPATWTAVRRALSDALSDDAHATALRPALAPITSLEFLLPFHVGDYTDFYASMHHASNVGAMFRPDNPLLPNYKWVPIGYHGRASSIVVSGTPVRRPTGQIKPPDAADPIMAPTRSLDYELELALFLGGHNAIGSTVPIASAGERLFGICLLNDWSARDVQSWEYQPLGPFLAKNFASTISPWVVTSDALIPFRVAMPARPEGDPAPLPYLTLADDTTFSIELEVSLATRKMRDEQAQPVTLSHVQYATAMYWTPAQLIAHHGSNGCNLSAGDLLGTGTISGAAAESRGCLLELTRRGAEPLQLPDGEFRGFLADGDEVTFRGRCEAPGTVAIGLGQCRGVIAPA